MSRQIPALPLLEFVGIIFKYHYLIQRDDQYRDGVCMINCEPHQHSHVTRHLTA
jgi:hypothetical protein